MHTSRQINPARLFLFLFLVAGLAASAQARSVYVITNHYGQVLTAYRVNGEHIEYQTTANDLRRHGRGPVGLALDPDSATLFVTYETFELTLDKIELLNARTMTSEQDTVTISGATSLAGIPPLTKQTKNFTWLTEQPISCSFTCGIPLPKR